MPALRDKIEEISELVSQLTDDEQTSLLKSLKRKSLLQKAERLRRSVEPNQVSMSEIVEEVRLVRQIRHDRG